MKNTPFQLIEALEARIAPAGLVTVTYNAGTGALILDGIDGADNIVSIFKTGKDTYRIEGTATGIDLGGVADKQDIIGKITSLTYNGGNQADQVTATGLNTLATLTFDGDAGLDSFTGRGLIVKGATTIGFGANQGTLTFADDNTLGGNLTVNYGADGGTVAADGDVLTIKGAVVLNGGAGADHFEMTAAIAKIGKGITFTAGAGSNLLSLRSPALTVGKSATGNAIEYTGGANVDSTVVEGAAARLNGGVSVALGDGDNSAKFTGALVAIAGGLTVSGGTGADSLSLGADPSTDSVTVKGPVAISQGNGANSITSGGAVLNLSGGLTVTGGVDDDNLDLKAKFLTVKGAVDIDQKAGGVLLNILHIGGSQAVFGSSVTIKQGDDADSATIDPGKLKVAGAFSVDQAAGDDFLDVEFTTIDAKKGFTFKGGNGNDIVLVVGDGLIKGDASFDLGSSDGLGGQFLNLDGASGLAGNLKFGGKLTITTTTVAGAGVLEQVEASNVAVAKAVQIDLGDADSNLFLENFIASDTLTVNTNAGIDSVIFEKAAATVGIQRALFGPSSVGKAATFNLGDDNDNIQIGVSSAGGSDQFVRFLGGLTVTGGAGADTSNLLRQATVNFFKPGTTPTSDIETEA